MRFINKNCRRILCYQVNYKRLSSTAKQERQGFGSFHSDDIEDIIRLPESKYHAPKEYDEITSMSMNRFKDLAAQNDGFTFGKHLKSNYYYIDPNFTFLNHGAFGASPNIAIEESNMWRQLCEKQPLRYFDRILLPVVAHVIRVVAKELSCPADELVPLPNVTSGLNSIAASMELSSGDEVVCFSITYGSTKKILQRLCAETNAKLVIIPLPLPIESTDSIAKAISSHLNSSAKLIILDSITSNTALDLPTVELAKLCKSIAPDARIVVDGAHSMFSQNISIYSQGEAIAENVDAFLTNCHKWLCSPKGAAFMWVSPRFKSKIRPSIISHGFVPSTDPFSSSNFHPGKFSQAGKLLSGYSWDGCRDYNALLTVPTMLRLWKDIDELNSSRTYFSKQDFTSSGSASRDYMRKLLDLGTELLANDWHIEEQRFAGPIAMRRRSPMILMPLPRMIRGVNTTGGTTDKEAFQLQELLHIEHRIEAPVKCLEGKLFIRLSVHIYNDLDDFVELSRVIRKLSPY